MGLRHRLGWGLASAIVVAGCQPPGPPKTLTLDLGNGVTMKLVLIPGGKFVMGSPMEYVGDLAPRVVTITKPFYIGATEVTQAQWRAVVGTKPWQGRKWAKEGSDRPATHISWLDAVAFCKRLPAKGHGTASLPTEAEWEYACRAGSRTKYCFGDARSELHQYAWYMKNVLGTGEEYAHRVARKKPNGWGLFDMHGNVWEWCADWYDTVGAAHWVTVDPRGPSSGDARALRGGAWGSHPQSCESAGPYGGDPAERIYHAGFRVVLRIPPQAAVGPAPVPKAAKQRIAVADFTVACDLGAVDAGAALARMLLTRLDAGRFDLVARDELAVRLAESKLTVAEIAADPAVLRSKKLAGIRYLVLGSVRELDLRLIISAHLVDILTGRVVTTADVSLDVPEALSAALDELAQNLDVSGNKRAEPFGEAVSGIRTRIRLDKLRYRAGQDGVQVALDALNTTDRTITLAMQGDLVDGVRVTDAEGKPVRTLLPREKRRWQDIAHRTLPAHGRTILIAYALAFRHDLSRPGRYRVQYVGPKGTVDLGTPLPDSNVVEFEIVADDADVRRNAAGTVQGTAAGRPSGLAWGQNRPRARMTYVAFAETTPWGASLTTRP